MSDGYRYIPGAYGPHGPFPQAEGGYHPPRIRVNRSQNPLSRLWGVATEHLGRPFPRQMLLDVVRVQGRSLWIDNQAYYALPEDEFDALTDALEDLEWHDTDEGMRKAHDLRGGMKRGSWGVYAHSKRVSAKSTIKDLASLDAEISVTPGKDLERTAWARGQVLVLFKGTPSFCADVDVDSAPTRRGMRVPGRKSEWADLGYAECFLRPEDSEIVEILYASDLSTKDQAELCRQAQEAGVPVRRLQRRKKRISGEEPQKSAQKRTLSQKLSRFGKNIVNPKTNPTRKIDGITVEPYDKARDQINAQRRAIYEDKLKRLLGINYKQPFRSPHGVRLDSALWWTGQQAFVREAHRFAFAAGTAVQQKTGWLKRGSQDITKRTRERSKERHEEKSEAERLLDKQNYEEMLAIVRENYYRVLTYAGKAYIWPMPPGQKRPKAMTVDAAVKQAKFLSERRDPRNTGRWWTP